jgi:hypothetical protein
MDTPTIGTIVRRPVWVLLVLLIALVLNIGAAFRRLEGQKSQSAALARSSWTLSLHARA